MESIAKTYLDLFNENRKAIEKGSFPLMNNAREGAREDYSAHGLPSLRSENYNRTDIHDLFSLDYGVNINGVQFPLHDTKGFSCDVEDMPYMQGIILNERFDRNLSQGLEQLPTGVYIGSLRAFLTEHPEREPQFAKIYGRYAETDIDGIVALNTMFAQDAVLLFVPKGVKVTEPLRLIQLVRADVPMLLFRRVLIVLEEESAIEVLVCNHTLDKHDFLVDQVIEMHVAENAQLKLYDVEESSSRMRHLSTLCLRQYESSKVLINGLTLNNGITRNSYWTRFMGPHAELTLAGLAIGTQAQHVDNFTYISHIFPECKTHELFKYIMDDEAVGAFAGRIFVSAQAQKTDAQQSNRNLLLSPNARVYSKPQLEIYADDVKCSHGMTTGQLDEEALFYMQQRGVSKDEARTLLSIAFTDDVVRLIELEPLRASIVDVISSRFNNQEIRHCNKCGKVCF